jgi:hypothetical protein
LLIGKAMQLEKIRHRQEQNGCAKSKKPPQKHLLPGKARLNCGVYFQMTLDAGNTLHTLMLLRPRLQQGKR